MPVPALPDLRHQNFQAHRVVLEGHQHVFEAPDASELAAEQVHDDPGPTEQVPDAEYAPDPAPDTAVVTDQVLLPPLDGDNAEAPAAADATEATDADAADHSAIPDGDANQPSATADGDAVAICPGGDDVQPAAVRPDPQPATAGEDVGEDPGWDFFLERKTDVAHETEQAVVEAKVSTAVSDEVSTAVSDEVSTAVSDEVSTAVTDEVSTAVTDEVSTAVTDEHAVVEQVDGNSDGQDSDSDSSNPDPPPSSSLDAAVPPDQAALGPSQTSVTVAAGSTSGLGLSPRRRLPLLLLRPELLRPVLLLLRPVLLDLELLAHLLREQLALLVLDSNFQTLMLYHHHQRGPGSRPARDSENEELPMNSPKKKFPQLMKKPLFRQGFRLATNEDTDFKFLI